MNNNDILRRLRYTFDYSDTKMIGVFRHADLAVTRVQLSGWMKKEEDPEYIAMPDLEMATFLNGLIIEKRGRQDGDQPVPERRLTNNIVFRKLKIALNYTAEDILEVLGFAGVSLSKHELSALFRKQGHQNFRECKDQVMRNFLSGLQIKLRGNATMPDADKPLRKTASTSDKPMRKPAEKPDVQFVVDKPAADKTGTDKRSVNSNSVWAKALEKSSKKS